MNKLWWPDFVAIKDCSVYITKWLWIPCQSFINPFLQFTMTGIMWQWHWQGIMWQWQWQGIMWQWQWLANKLSTKQELPAAYAGCEVVQAGSKILLNWSRQICKTNIERYQVKVSYAYFPKRRKVSFLVEQKIIYIIFFTDHLLKTKENL